METGSPSVASISDSPCRNPCEEAAFLHIGHYLKEAGYRFTTVTPETYRRVNARPENAWARELRCIFGWSRPFRYETLPRSLLDWMHSANLVVPEENGLRSRVRASSLGQDLYFHSAYPTKEADAVFFGPDTYRFAAAIRRHAAGIPQARVRNIVDIGCGAGPGAVLAAQLFPGAEVVAVDINEQALRMTRINAELAKTSNVHVCYSNLLQDVPGSFDLILANPPYLVDPGERIYRHGGGTYGWDLSLAIIDTALERLAPGGNLLLYTGVAMVHGEDLFYDAVRRRMQGELLEWEYDEIDPDVFGEELAHSPYAKAERIAAVVLTVSKRRATLISGRNAPVLQDIRKIST